MVVAVVVSLSGAVFGHTEDRRISLNREKASALGWADGGSGFGEGGGQVGAGCGPYGIWPRPDAHCTAAVVPTASVPHAC